MGNRERAFEIFAVASLLEARGANPYRVRAYRRAALRLLRLSEDASRFLNERGELALPGLGQRLRRKLGELVRTGRLSFHDELLAAEPRPIRTLMTVPGIGPKTADRLVGECNVRGLKSLARAAREGRLQRLRGIGPARELAWGEAAALLLASASASQATASADTVERAAAEPVPAAVQISFLADDAETLAPPAAVEPSDGSMAAGTTAAPAEEHADWAAAAAPVPATSAQRPPVRRRRSERAA